MAADTRWWGWGDARHPVSLSPRALAYLRERLALESQPRPPVALEQVRLHPPAIDEPPLAALRDAVGTEHVRDDRLARIVHAAGKGYLDLVRLRAGAPEGAPDAVVYPGSREQLQAVLDMCARRSLAVVPFGGGTSVVGGLAPVRGPHRAVVALDLRRLSALVDVDERSRTVVAQAGMRARDLESALARKRLTLGHFPQSFEHVSLGGCAATRSAGQGSSGYGRFDEMVLGLSLCAPAGTLDLHPAPASAAGPDLRQLVLGSEGALGVIDRLALRVREAPRERLYEGVFFADFDHGVEVLRELAQRDLAPTITRLSDALETEVSLALARHGGLIEGLARSYLRARGYARGCLAIFGFEGHEHELRRWRRRAHAIVRAHGGLPVGRRPGEAWLASRFSAPYLRDELLTHGVMVETLETATSWSKLAALADRIRAAVSRALDELGTPGLVACHVSHVYETGASLYFTLLAPQRYGAEEQQWHSVKQAAGEAILAGGGTISHHHGIGRDHMAFMQDEIGRDGVAVLQALKHRLDPQAIMNPGKLIAA